MEGEGVENGGCRRRERRVRERRIEGVEESGGYGNAAILINLKKSRTERMITMKAIINRYY